MAINKKKTSTGMKAVLIFVAVAFIASIVLPAFIGWGGSPETTGASESALLLEQLASTYAPAIASGTAQLEVDPEDYDALVGLGNTYYDWALQIVNSFGQGTGNDLPMWVAATVHYERALAVDAGDPNVWTDMAIAYFYAGDRDRAIEAAETVFEEFPDFAPIYYNASIFYREVGRTSDAIASLERFLVLEPEGDTADSARQLLTELEGAAPMPTPGVPRDADGSSIEETAQP